MSGIDPFQFEPIYPPGEEPIEGEDEELEGDANETDVSMRIRNTEWCLCGVCASMPLAEECYSCQELEELDQKFGVEVKFSSHICFFTIAAILPKVRKRDPVKFDSTYIQCYATYVHVKFGRELIHPVRERSFFDSVLLILY